MTAVIGLDLSLTSTGVATVTDGGQALTAQIRPSATLTGYPRLQWLLEQIHQHATDTRLVLVEGPSYGSGSKGRQSGQHERAGLWWAVTYRLWRNNITFAVVSPANLKKYATGKGNASKDAVLIAAARRYQDVYIDGNDEADALILAAMGADYLGFPLAVVPKVNRGALDSVEWPDLVAFTTV